MRDPIDPWDRRVGETSYNYRAFIVFRDLGPGRTLDGVVLKDPLFSRGSVGTWAARHDWTDRAAAWDDHLQRLADDAIRAGTIEWKHRCLALADRALAVTAAKLELIEENPGRLTPSEMIKLGQFATQLGTLMRGEVTERTEHTVVGLDPERLWKLVQSNPNIADEVERFEGLLRDAGRVDA